MAERVQVKDLASPENIRPSASPVDTYYRPAEDQVAKVGTQAQWAKDLAEGLDVINPSVNRLGEAQQKRYTEEELRRGAEARDRNMASFKDAINKKLIPEGASPWFKKGYEQQSGRLEGMEYDTALRLAWSQSPIQNSDDPKAYNEFVADFRKNFLQERQGATSNNDWYEGFAPMMGRAENNLGAQHISHRQHEIAVNVRENLSRESAGMIDSFRDSQRSSLTGLAEANASVDDIRNAKVAGISTLGANLSAMTADLVKKGLSGSDANKIVTDSIIVKARESRDADMLMLLDHVQTGNGTLSGTQYAKQQRLATEDWLLDYDYKERMHAEAIASIPYHREQQEQARKGWEWADKERARAASEQNRHDETRFLQGSLNALVTSDASRPVDPVSIARLEKLNPGAGQSVLAYQNFMLTNKERIVTNNQAYISVLSDMQKDPGHFNVQRIWDGVPARQYDAGVATTLFNEYKSLQSDIMRDPILKDQVFLEYRQKLVGTVAGSPATTNDARIANSGEAGVAFFRDVRDFNKANANASEADKFGYMRKRYYELIQEFNKDTAGEVKVIQDEAQAKAAKVAAEAQAVKDAETTKRNQALNSRLQEISVPMPVLRAYRDAVGFGDDQAQAEILKKYPQLATKKKAQQ